jgi:drug/metabolite transporter superfamily protein YnfA
MVGILATWLQEQLRVAWALFGTVVLIAYAVRMAMQKRPSFLLTEAGDFLLTEAGDRFLLE